MPGTLFAIALGPDRLMHFPEVTKMARSGWLFLSVTGIIWKAKELLPESIKPLFRKIYHRFLGEP
jgi:hypothetical protein